MNGLFYVALSRVRTFKGIHLKRSVRESDMAMDEMILSMYQKLEHVENLFESEKEESS